eukprot:1148949-Pelagomonas_calceolata.AAC.8
MGGLGKKAILFQGHANIPSCGPRALLHAIGRSMHKSREGRSSSRLHTKEFHAADKSPSASDTCAHAH